MSNKVNLQMSDIVIYLRLDTYLAQWLTHEHGGHPVVFPKNSVEHNILETFLTTRPPFGAQVGPGENRVAIQLPYLKNKNVRYSNFLPHSARRSLANSIRNRFIIALWNDLYRFGNIGRRKQDLIWAWMEAHGIDATETNWNTIAKIYKRKRDAYQRQQKQLEKERGEENDPP